MSVESNPSLNCPTDSFTNTCTYAKERTAGPVEIKAQDSPTESEVFGAQISHNLYDDFGSHEEEDPTFIYRVQDHHFPVTGEFYGDDPFTWIYGEMDDESFHRMMNFADVTYDQSPENDSSLSSNWQLSSHFGCENREVAREGVVDPLRSDVQSFEYLETTGGKNKVSRSSNLESTGHADWAKLEDLWYRDILYQEMHDDLIFLREEDLSDYESEEWHSCESSGEDDYFEAKDTLVASRDPNSQQVPESLGTNQSAVKVSQATRRASECVGFPSSVGVAPQTSDFTLGGLSLRRVCDMESDVVDYHGQLYHEMSDEEVYSELTGEAVTRDLRSDTLANQDQFRSGCSAGPLPTYTSSGGAEEVSGKLFSGDVGQSDPFRMEGCSFFSAATGTEEDEVWSIFTDTLHYLSEPSSGSLSYNHDLKRSKNAKRQYFDPAHENVPHSSTDERRMRKESKTEHFNAANCNTPMYSQNLFPRYEETRYGDVRLIATSTFNPNSNICATYLWTEDEGKNSPLVTDAYNEQGEKLWFKKGRFRMNIDGESVGRLLDDTPVKVVTLIDTGCSKPILNKKFVDQHPQLQDLPRYKVPSIKVKLGDDRTIPVSECVQIIIKFDDHVFEFIAYLADMSIDFDFVIGQKSMYELEAAASYRNLSFNFLMRSLPLKVGRNLTVHPGKTKDLVLKFDELPTMEHDRPHEVVVKLKTGKNTLVVQSLIATMHEKTIVVQVRNNTDTSWNFRKGQEVGCADMRSVGFFHISRDMLEEIIKYTMKERCTFLTEQETSEYFDLWKKDHSDVLRYARQQVKPGNTVLVDRKGATPENDTNIVEDKEKDPYPWLPPDDPRRTMTDREILEKYVDLSDSLLTEKEKKQLYDLLMEHRDAFSLRDEIGLCPHMEVELELNDTSPFFIRPFPIKESDKDIVDREMRKGVVLGILKKGMSSYSSPVMLIPRKLTGIPRIVTDFRHLNSRLVTLQPSIPLVRDAIQILGSSGCEVMSLADLRDAYHTLRLSKKSQKYCGITPYYGSDTYLYQRLGMGLSVSPAIWQNFIQRVLQEIPNHRKHHLAIMDDCLVHSTKKEHWKHLTDLLQALVRNGLKISPRKCKLFKTSLVYMGLQLLIVDGVPRILPLKSRIEAILKLDPPKSVKDCRSFCGMVNFLSMFLPSLQDKLTPIYFLTRKGVPYHWGEEQQRAFEQIKHDCANAPMLTMPNSHGHFSLVSDTSKIGCGAALYQEQGLPPAKYLVGYYSKKLPEAVQRYSISELELTGIMANVAAFKHLLRNANFTVYSDHSALIHILKAKREPPTLRIKKLVENLSEYKFDIKFINGRSKEMTISDFLSRHPDNDTDSPHEIIPISFRLSDMAKTLRFLDKTPDELDRFDSESFASSTFLSDIQTFKFRDDVVKYKTRVCYLHDESKNNRYADLTLEDCDFLDDTLLWRPGRPIEVMRIMTRKMIREKAAEVPPMYPLIGDNKKPEKSKRGIIQVPENAGDQVNYDDPIVQVQRPDVMQEDPVPDPPVHPEPRRQQVDDKERYVDPGRVHRRPNPILEPSINRQAEHRQVRQLPEYENLLNPVPLNIELRGRLPSCNVDNVVANYQFGMELPSIESLEREKQKLLHKIPDSTIFSKHIPKQVELNRFLERLKQKVIHDYNIPVRAKELRAEYKNSPYFRDILKYITTGYCGLVGKAQRVFKQQCEDFIVMKGLLFKLRYAKGDKEGPGLVLCVPEKYIPIILYQYHAPLLAGHPGIVKMYLTVRRKYYFPAMMTLIRQFVESCLTCQSMKAKTGEPRIHYPRLPLDTRPMKRISMDIKDMPPSSMGYRCILVCTCEFTNWVKAIPLVNQQAATIAEALYFRVICDFGVPEAVICDEGPAFTSQLMKEYFHALNISPYYISPMNHGSNRTERYIRTLNDILCKNLSGVGDKWPLFVFPSVWAMNTQVSQVTNFTPFEMVYHMPPPDLFNFNFDPDRSGLKVTTKSYMTLMERRKQLINSLVTERRTYEKESTLVRELRKFPDRQPFAVGDLVMIDHNLGSDLQAPSKKLKRNWIGPVRIQAILDDTHYLCSDWSGRLVPKTFHVNRLKPCRINLGSLDEEGMLEVAKSTADLYKFWKTML